MSLVLGFSFWMTFRVQFQMEAHKSDRSYSFEVILDLGGKEPSGSEVWKRARRCRVVEARFCGKGGEIRLLVGEHDVGVH